MKDESQKKAEGGRRKAEGGRREGGRREVKKGGGRMVEERKAPGSSVFWTWSVVLTGGRKILQVVELPSG